MWSYQCDLTAAIRSHVGRGAKAQDFPLKVFGEYWWVDIVQAKRFMEEASLGHDVEIYARGRRLRREDKSR